MKLSMGSSGRSRNRAGVGVPKKAAWLLPTAVLLALFLSLGHCSAQGTFQWTVTFDGSPPIARGDEVAISYYYEQGMVFTPIGTGQFGRSGGGIPQRADDGTAFLVAAFGYSLAVAEGGAQFGLVSVDLAEYSTVVPNAVTVQFIGFRPDGKTVSTNFTTDGIMDGTGPLADFQTFHFDSQFADVVRVEVPGYRWSLDNMVFQSVPEPSASALTILGAVLLAVRFSSRGLRAAR